MTTTTSTQTQDPAELFSRLGIEYEGGDLEVRSPITGEPIAQIHSTTDAEAEAAIARSVECFHAWRDVPAPRRGELVRLLGEELRREKETLGALVTLEAGKIAQEGLGEVQEMIDICDFAVGLSRQLYGLTIASERPGHRMAEIVAPAGADRRDHGVQLPGRGLELELRAGIRLRRSRAVEAVVADAADGARLPLAAAARRRALRRCAGRFA